MSTTELPSWHLGAPQVSGPLCVVPIFGDEPGLQYRSLSQAVERGAFISEVDAQGSVNDVLVCNTTDQPLLLYEGEIIRGARQNRTIDAPVLAPAGVKLSVPVSCVERGRWEHGRRAEHFAPTAFTVDPRLRTMKRQQANDGHRRRLAPRPDQRSVWSEVQTRMSSHAVASPSSALTAIYEHKQPRLEQFTTAIQALDGQVGAVVELSGRCVALDFVSRPEVFADLLPRLTQGYALQALNAGPGEPSVEAAREFVGAVLGAPRDSQPTPGVGEAFAPAAPGLEGCGLTVGGELVALSAFPVGSQTYDRRS